MDYGKLIGGRRWGGHAGESRELAEELGREYAESYSLPPGARSMPVFADWSDGRCAMTSRADEAPVTLFDYTTITECQKSDTVRKGTAALLTVDGLADFDLRPWTLGRRIHAWAGFKGVSFDPAAANAIDAETVRRFTKLFRLSAWEPLALVKALTERTSLDPADSEGAVRRLFTPAVMELVNQYPAYAIQSRPGFLAVWRGSGVLPAGKRAELLDAAVDLRRFLTSPPKGRSCSIVPGRAGTDVGIQAQQLRNTTLGGVLGLVVGFILATMNMFMVSFRLPMPKSEFATIGMVLFFGLILVGLILVGAAVGAGIGSLVPVGHLPPRPAESPAQRKRRQWVTGCGQMVGIVSGFFGGLIVFAATRICFNWKLDFGVEAAIFFGSGVGGAILGTVIGGTVAKRLYRWRHRRKPTS